MSIIPYAILLGEYAVAGIALAWGVAHDHHGSSQSSAAASDDPPDKNDDSGITPDDDDPGNNDGGIIPGSELPRVSHAGPHDTYESLAVLEARRQWALLRRAWIRTARHIPWMTISGIILLYKNYHIYLSVREALSLRRATRALEAGHDIPPETPIEVRRMMYLAHVGVNEGVRAGAKRLAGYDPFGDIPPRPRRQR